MIYTEAYYDWMQLNASVESQNLRFCNWFNCLTICQAKLIISPVTTNVKSTLIHLLPLVKAVLAPK
jgi:hypothetical protein